MANECCMTSSLVRCCTKMLVAQPSSAAAGKVYSLLSNSLSQKQYYSLQDYIELSLMLQYNLLSLTDSPTQLQPWRGLQTFGCKLDRRVTPSNCRLEHNCTGSYVLYSKPDVEIHYFKVENTCNGLSDLGKYTYISLNT